MKRMTDPLSASAWPPTTFSLPELWARIAAMFAVLMREARSTVQLARRETTYQERHAIRCRLLPLEKLMRSLLLTEAIIHLLMTSEGRALIANAKPVSPPLRMATPTTSHATPVQPHTQTPRDTPAAFRVLGWASADEDDDTPLAHPPVSYAYEERSTKLISGRHLARRIETLTHVLNDREPTVLRLAKFIASLPRHALGLPAVLAATSLGWWHGRPEYFNAIALEKRAVIALQHSEDLHDDPG